MPAPVYTREQLDKTQCSIPGCTEDHGPLYFHSRCHPSGDIEAYYEDGLVVIACSLCKQEVVRVEVT